MKLHTLILLLLFITNNLFSQNKYSYKPPHLIKYSLNELAIRDNNFIISLDSIISHPKYSETKQKHNITFFLYINKNKKYNDSVFINVSQSIIEPDGRGCLGYFKYKNHTFFVCGGMANIMFSKTFKKSIFSLLEVMPTPTNDPPEWDMLFCNKKVSLLKFYGK